jgi:hypothetical protein
MTDDDPDDIPIADVADLLEEGEHGVRLTGDQERDVREFAQLVQSSESVSKAETDGLVRICHELLDEDGLNPDAVKQDVVSDE